MLNAFGLRINTCISTILFNWEIHTEGIPHSQFCNTKCISEMFSKADNDKVCMADFLKYQSKSILRIAVFAI